MLRGNLRHTVDWVESLRPHLRFTPPKAGGMAFMRYDFDINSTELADWLRTEQSVFILAGDTYGMDGFFRIGIGAEKESLLAGFDRVRGALTKRFGKTVASCRQGEPGNRNSGFEELGGSKRSGVRSDRIRNPRSRCPSPSPASFLLGLGPNLRV